MAEYIEREALIKKICEEKCRSEYQECQKGRHGDKIVLCVCDFIRLQPKADVEPVVHAHWIRKKLGYPPICSNCQSASLNAPEHSYYYYAETPRCPWCGARMDRRA